MIDKTLIPSLIDCLDEKNMEMNRVVCQSLRHLSMNPTLLPTIHQTGLRLFEEILESTDDPIIFCSLIVILNDSIGKNRQISEKIMLNMINFLRNSSSTGSDLMKVVQSLNGLTKMARMIELFKREDVYKDLIVYLSEESNVELQSSILSLLEEAAKDIQSAKFVRFDDETILSFELKKEMF